MALMPILASGGGAGGGGIIQPSCVFLRLMLTEENML